MTTFTTSTSKLVGSVSDNNVDIGILNQSNLVLNNKLSQFSNPLSALAVYDYRSGDPTYPATVRSRMAVDGPKVLIPTFQWTVAFETLQLTADEDSNIVEQAPEQWGIWYRGPQKRRSTAATISRGFGSVLGLTGGSIASGVIDTGRIGEVLYLDPFVFGS